MKSKGFTLIELLVVISIIALLSSVVLSSLTTARAKGIDNAIKSALKQIAIQTEVYRDANTSMGANAVCTVPETFVFSDPIIKKQIAEIKLRLVSPATVTCSTDSTGTKWAVSVANLKYAASTWCMDNNQGWFKAGTVNANGQCQ